VKISRTAYLLLAYLLVGALVWFQCYDGMIREIFYSFHLNKNLPSNKPTGDFGILYAFIVVVSLMSCSSLLIKFKLKQFQNVLFK
jgi:hypothetical protein